MDKSIRIQLPLDDKTVRSLKAGDSVLLSGAFTREETRRTNA